jgi:hypothetical protein
MVRGFRRFKGEGPGNIPRVQRRDVIGIIKQVVSWFLLALAGADSEELRKHVRFHAHFATTKMGGTASYLASGASK